MRPSVSIFVVGAILALVVALAMSLVTRQIGGSSIRTAAVQQRSAGIEVTSPLTPGVPVAVRWTDDSTTLSDVDVYFRSAARDIPVRYPTEGETVTIMIPCDLNESTGTLTVRDKRSTRVLAREIVSVLPPGRDCALSR